MFLASKTPSLMTFSVVSQILNFATSRPGSFVIGLIATFSGGRKFCTLRVGLVIITTCPFRLVGPPSYRTAFM